MKNSNLHSDNNLFRVSFNNTIPLKLQPSNDGYIPNMYSFADGYHDNPPDIGFIILNPDGVIKEVNNAGLGLLGSDRVNLINKHFIDYVSFKDTVNWSKFVSSIMHTSGHNTKQYCEIALTRKRQSEIYVRVDGVFLSHKENNKVLRLILTDITARKKSESALNASDTRFLNIIKDLEPLRQTVRPERAHGYYY